MTQQSGANNEQPPPGSAQAKVENSYFSVALAFVLNRTVQSRKSIKDALYEDVPNACHAQLDWLLHHKESDLTAKKILRAWNQKSIRADRGRLVRANKRLDLTFGWLSVMGASLVFIALAGQTLGAAHGPKADYVMPVFMVLTLMYALAIARVFTIHFIPQQIAGKVARALELHGAVCAD